MSFTPIESTIGGALIGLAAAHVLVVHGRVAGISGIVNGCLKAEKPTSDTAWCVAHLYVLWDHGTKSPGSLLAGPTCGKLIRRASASNSCDTRWSCQLRRRLLFLGGMVAGSLVNVLCNPVVEEGVKICINTFPVAALAFAGVLSARSELLVHCSTDPYN